MVRWTRLVMRRPSMMEVPEIGGQEPGLSETCPACSQGWRAYLIYCLTLVGTGVGVSLLGWRAPQTGALRWVLPALGGYLGGGTVLMGLLYGLKGLGWPLELHLAGPRARRGLRFGTRLVLGPFLLALAGLLLLSRTLGRSRFFDEISPGLFLGAAPFPWHRGRLRRRGVTAIVNLCFEFEDPSGLGRRGEVASFHLPTLDGTPPGEGFEPGILWAAGQMSRGGTLFVHCAQGHGRSATFVAVLLVHTGLATSVEEAIRAIRVNRPRIRLTEGQAVSARRCAESLALCASSSCLNSSPDG